MKTRGEISTKSQLSITPISKSSSAQVHTFAAAAHVVSQMLTTEKKSQVLVEPFVPVERAFEFSIVILEGNNGPIALLPLKIDSMQKKNETESIESFADVTYKTKSLGHHNSEHKTKNREKISKTLYDELGLMLPQKIPIRILQRIRRCAEKLFDDISLKDFSIINGLVIGEDSDMFISPVKKRSTVLSSPSLYEFPNFSISEHDIHQNLESEEILIQHNHKEISLAKSIYHTNFENLLRNKLVSKTGLKNRTNYQERMIENHKNSKWLEITKRSENNNWKSKLF
jgi:hypothetical protein